MLVIVGGVVAGISRETEEEDREWRRPLGYDLTKLTKLRFQGNYIGLSATQQITHIIRLFLLLIKIVKPKSKSKVLSLKGFD